MLNPSEVLGFMNDVKSDRYLQRSVLSIHGKPGTGKSVLAHHITKASRGVNVMTVNDMNVLDILGFEIGRVEGAELLIVDGDNYPDEGILKNLCESSRLHVNVRNGDDYTIKNKLRGIIVMTTASIEIEETILRRRIITDIDTAYRCFAMSDLTT